MATVVLLVGCMFVTGVGVVQPAVFGPQRSPLHALLAVLVTFNILL